MVFLDESFEITIEGGRVTSVSENAPLSFKEIVHFLKNHEEEGNPASNIFLGKTNFEEKTIFQPVWVREFGIGLNSAIGRGTPLIDSTAFERQLGIHLSIGKKHTVYKRPELIHTSKRKRKLFGFHVDLFLEAEQLQFTTLEEKVSVGIGKKFDFLE